MADIKAVVQAQTSLTVTGLNALNAATYVVSEIIDHSVNDPLDVLVDVEITLGGAAGNTTAGRQIVVFAKGSIDGTNFSSGPEANTDATNEAQLHFVGTLPIAANLQTGRKTFSLAAAFGGLLPKKTKLVFKNDTGTVTTGASVQYAEVWGTSS